MSLGMEGRGGAGFFLMGLGLGYLKAARVHLFDIHVYTVLSGVVKTLLQKCNEPQCFSKMGEGYFFLLFFFP